MDTLVKELLDSYPEQARLALTRLRELIMQTGKEYEVGPVEESLKWGEPSYSAKGGSTVRIDWKAKFPGECLVYFHCQTRLVETFKELYGDTFKYDGKRAIVIDLSQEISTQELKHCISLALKYHKLKHLPLLGA
ncbi:MAG: DUF1801 domain-containing protein [Gammaproteobacteria bacterium]